MIKKNGYSMIEVIIASSLFLSAVTIFVPILSQLQLEKYILSERRTIAFQLQEELQQYIWTNDSLLPATYVNKHAGNTLHFQFTEVDDFIKGCVKWQNAKQKNESFCLYALSN